MSKPLAPIRVTAQSPRVDRDGNPKRQEAWAAVTLDGAWKIERTEDPGTPWTLRQAREIIASGMAEIRANVRKAGQEAFDASMGLPAHERDAARFRAENEAVARFMQERRS